MSFSDFLHKVKHGLSSATHVVLHGVEEGAGSLFNAAKHGGETVVHVITRGGSATYNHVLKPVGKGLAPAATYVAKEAE
jgi:hypothetical protein